MILRGEHFITVPADYKPLKLKAVTARLKLAQVDLARAVRQKSGKPLSSAAISQLINHGTWPKETAAFEVRAQLAAYLQSMGATAVEIDSAFEPDALTDAPTHPNIGHRNGMPVHTTRAPIPANAPTPQFQPLDLPETEMLAEKTLAHFKLYTDPFHKDVRSAKDVFLSDDFRYVREAMFSAARNQDFIAVIGESGAGKSVLRMDLIERIARENAKVRVIMPQTIDKSRLSATAIGRAVIRDLVPNEIVPNSLEDQARKVRQLLINGARDGTSFVLLIEEAHDLTKTAIKQLKRFREIGDGFQQPLGIVLIGQPELRDLLDESKNYDAREVIRRISVVTLQPLDGNVRKYVEHKMHRVERPANSVFEDNTYDAIRECLTQRIKGTDMARSNVYPLIVNNVVCALMNEAARIGAPTVSPVLVKTLFPNMEA
jgi:type II secretory pathway predicted ATPase ExeA